MVVIFAPFGGFASLPSVSVSALTDQKPMTLVGGLVGLLDGPPHHCVTLCSVSCVSRRSGAPLFAPEELHAPKCQHA